MRYPLALGLLLSAISVSAQVPATSIKIDLKTPVRLSITDAMSSKNAKAGDTFGLAAADDVTVNGHVVIAKGASATGRIIAAEKRKFATQNGKLEITVDSVKAVDGHNVPLDGHLTVGGGGVSYGHPGKNAEIEKGQIINAVVAAETEVKL